MKIKKLLPLFAVSFLGLTGCGDNPNADPGGEKEYEIAEADYLVLRSKLADYRLFLNMNFTVSGLSNVKIDNGKVDFDDSDNHEMFSFNAETYNVDMGTCEATYYRYNPATSVWEKSEKEVISLSNLYFQTQLYYLTALPSAFNDLVYDAASHSYSAYIKEISMSLTFNFENSKLTRLSATGEIEISFEYSAYGSTVVTLPTV